MSLLYSDLFGGSKICPLVLIIIVELKRITVCRIDGIKVIGKTELLGKPVPALLIRTSPGSNQALRKERPATNRLHHCTGTRQM